MEEDVVISACLSADCFHKAVTYSVPKEQLEALIDLSENCDQDIEVGENIVLQFLRQ